MVVTEFLEHTFEGWLIVWNEDILDFSWRSSACPQPIVSVDIYLYDSEDSHRGHMTRLSIQETAGSPWELCLEVVVFVSVLQAEVHAHRQSSLLLVRLHCTFVADKLFVE